MLPKEEAYNIIEKFNQETIHALIKKLFADGLISDEDLDYAYFDESEVAVEVPALHFKTKKPITINKRVSVCVSIEITEE